MAYTMKCTGLDELGSMLEKMAEKAPAVAAQALYEGAGAMAKEVESQAGAIRTAPFKYATVSRGEMREASPEEKAAVTGAGGVGIAKFQKDGSEVQTSVGYGNAGYAEIKGKAVAIAKIANSINSGTSFMKKQPFIRKAATAGKGKAVDAMRAVIEKAYETK